ncbi:MAG: hypothetical protein ACFFD4_30890 [Candidatus Odinarchaeota archaeon]
MNDKRLQSIDLSLLPECKSFQSILLENNKLEEIDLQPLKNYSNLRGILLKNNTLKTADLTPVATFLDFQHFSLDDSVEILLSNKFRDKQLPPAIESLKKGINWIE